MMYGHYKEEEKRTTFSGEKKKREIVGEQEDGLTRGHPASPACVRQGQLLPSEPLALR